MTLETPLRDAHLAHGAKLIDFGGWNMPLQYTGVVAEHNAVRSAAGLFDVSHLGKLLIEGPEATEALDRTLPGKVARLAPWRAAYNLILNESCGIIDDVFVYRRPESWMVVPNASNADEVKAYLSEVAGLSVTEGRERFAIIALSGPKALTIVQQTLQGASDLKMHRFADLVFDTIPVTVARTGYTGEFTFEFFVSWERSSDLWDRLLDLGQPHGLVPAGLGARDTLRLEMGYPLHGQEIDVDINPIEANLEWVMDWDKDFLYKPDLERIKQEGVSRTLVGLLAHGRGIARGHHKIVADGVEIGEVVSGNFSPVLGRGIAMGYVPPAHSAPGTMLSVDVRGKSLPVEVTRPPFIKSR